MSNSREALAEKVLAHIRANHAKLEQEVLALLNADSPVSQSTLSPEPDQIIDQSAGVAPLQSSGRNVVASRSRRTSRASTKLSDRATQYLHAQQINSNSGGWEELISNVRRRLITKKPYELEADSDIATKLRTWKTKASSNKVTKRKKEWSALECDMDSKVAEKYMQRWREKAKAQKRETTICQPRKERQDRAFSLAFGSDDLQMAFVDGQWVHLDDDGSESGTAKVVPVEDSKPAVDKTASSTNPKKMGTSDDKHAGQRYKNWNARQLQFGRKKQHGYESIIPVPLPGEQHEWDKHYGKEVRGRILLPDSWPARVWDVLILMLIIYYAISVPLLYAFDDVQPPPEALEILFSSIFILDLARNFVTAIEVKGSLLVGYNVIARHYLRSWFLVDSLTSIPFEFMLPTSEGEFMRMMKMMKMIRIVKVLKLRRLFVNIDAQTGLFLKLGIQVCFILIVTHWIACTYWNLTRIDRADYLKDETLSPFMMQIGYTATSVSVQYIYAFFWSWMGATSFGIPTSPVTFEDCLLSIAVICCGLVITALLIGSVTSAMSQINAEKKQRTQKMEVTLAHLRSRMVSPQSELYKKVRGYCEFITENNIDAQQESAGSDALDHLPESLRVELMVQMNAEVCRSSGFFKNINPIATFELFNEMERIVFIPGDRIIQEGELDLFMYILLKGRVQLTKYDDVEHTEIPIRIMTGDSVFGENGLLGLQRTASVIAVSYCDTLALGQHSFMTIMQTQPNYVSLVSSMKQAKEMKDLLPSILEQMKPSLSDKDIQLTPTNSVSIRKTNSVKNIRANKVLVQNSTEQNNSLQTPKAKDRKASVSTHLTSHLYNSFKNSPQNARSNSQPTPQVAAIGDIPELPGHAGAGAIQLRPLHSTSHTPYS